MVVSSVSLLCSALAFRGALSFGARDDTVMLQAQVKEGLSLLQGPPGASHPMYPWAGKNGDASRTGSSAAVATSAIAGGPSWSFHEAIPEEIFKQFPTVKTSHPDWKDGLVRAAPLIDDKRNIYLATVSFGNVYKFSPEGKNLWKYNSSKQLPDIPAIMDGRLFVSTNEAEVVALDMETGKELWKRRVAAASAGDTWAMAAGEGVVISAVMVPETRSPNNRRLVALRADDGQQLWTFDPQGGDIYNILVSIKDGSCVFSTATGKVYRLSLDTGKVIWETPMPESPSFSTGGTVIGPNGVVYTTWNEQRGQAGAFQWGQGMLGAFDFKTGARLWATDVEYEANNAAAVGRLANGRLGVVIGIGSNPEIPSRERGVLDGKGPVNRQRIVAVDAETGKLTWTYQLPDWHGSALGDEKRPDICLPDAFGNPAIGGDGSAYVGHASGLLYSINDKDGDGVISPAEVATWQTGAAFQGSPGIAPDMLVATPCNGMHVWLQKPAA